MKCLIVHGSPRRGNTWDVLNIVKEELNYIENIDFDMIELRKENLDMCIGCFNCILKGEDKCPHKNKTNILINKMDEANIIILTSPVYSMQVSALMKNFIDHMSFNFHRQRYYNKKALVITTTAGAGHKDAANYLKKVLQFWGIAKVFTIPVAYRAEKLTEKNILFIKKEAKLFKDHIKKETENKAGLKQVAMYNFWRGMSSKEDVSIADYNFYKDKKNVYYNDIRVSFINKIIGNIVYKFMKK